MSQINVYELYLDSLDLINENERGGVNLDRWNRSANRSVRDILDYLTGRLSEEPTPRLAIFRDQKITDLCAPIVKRLMQPFSGGLIPYPKDLNYMADLRLSGSEDWKPGDCCDLPKFTIDEILNGQQGFRQVDILSHDEIPSRVNTHIPLLKKRLVAETYQDGMTLYNGPRSGTAFFAYLIEPDITFLAMSEDSDTLLLQYDPANSKNPPFNKNLQNPLARKIADYYFLFSREEAGMGLSANVQKTE